MHALSIRFHLPQDTDWQAITQLMRERAALYSGVEGLVSKAFILNPDTCEYGGNYVWRDREAADAFLNTQLFQAAVKRFGAPSIHRYDVAAYLDHGQLVLS
jgi:Domain of unknown function (DUF4865)/Putative mono-oxygenase ydhR